MRTLRTCPPARLATPYSLLAPAYDDVIGRRFFDGLRQAFERIVAAHRIAFRSAADLGCGTGLFARYLDSLWKIPVFGVDLSPAMLRVAAENCRGTNVRLLRQDIRELALPARVDLVTANFDTVNHLLDARDLARLFRRVHRELVPGGHFIFDFITPCFPIAGSATNRRRSADGRADVVQRIRWAPDGRTLLYRLLFGGPSWPRGRVELHRERTYWPQEVAAALMDAGFTLRSVLDATTMRPARRCKGRIVVVAQKRA